MVPIPTENYYIASKHLTLLEMEFFKMKQYFDILFTDHWTENITHLFLMLLNLILEGRVADNNLNSEVRQSIAQLLQYKSVQSKDSSKRATQNAEKETRNNFDNLYCFNSTFTNLID